MLLTSYVDPRRIPMHYFQTRLFGPDAPPQLLPLLPRQPLYLTCWCRHLVRHDRIVLCLDLGETRPGRDSVNTLSNGVVPAAIQAGCHQSYDRQGQSHTHVRARSRQCVTAIACRVSLPLFSPSFWLLRRRPAPLGTHVNALKVVLPNSNSVFAGVRTRHARLRALRWSSPVQTDCHPGPTIPGAILENESAL